MDDLDFWLRVVSAGYDVRVIPHRLAVFRVESGSVSRPLDPAAREELDGQLERALRRAAEATGNPSDLAAFHRVERHIGYLRALRRGRTALAAGNVREARRECRRALELGRSPRAAAMVAALSIAPGLSVRGLPVKRAVQASFRDAGSRRRSRR